MEVVLLEHSSVHGIVGYEVHNTAYGMYVCTYPGVWVMYVHMYLYIHTYVRIYISTLYISMYVRTCVCMYICIYTLHTRVMCLLVFLL